MYGNQLAGQRSGVPPMMMAGLGLSWGISPERKALEQKSVWDRQDWAAYFGTPAGWYQPPDFPHNYGKTNPFRYQSTGFRSTSAAVTANNLKYARWPKLQPTLKKEYKAAKAKIDAAKKVADDKIKQEKLEIEEAAKQQELDTKIKTAEGSAQSQVDQVMRQWQQQSAAPASGGDGKILGMNKKTAMIAGGVGAAVIAIFVIAN